MKNYMTALFTLVLVLFLIGCDSTNTSSEPAPLTYGGTFTYLGVQYHVVSGDTVYFYTGESLVIGSPFVVNQDGSYTPSTKTVEVVVGNDTYQTGDVFTVGPGSTLLVTVDGYAFQVATAATPDGRFIGDLGLRNNTWGDVYGDYSLHYTGASDVLGIMVWTLTGWEQSTATASGSQVTPYDDQGQPHFGSGATTITVNPGVSGDVWVQLLRESISANIHLWVAPGTMPARSTGTDVRVVAYYQNGTSVIVLAVPEGFSGSGIDVTIQGSVFGSYMTRVGIDASGYGVEYIGEPRGTGQAYTVTPASGQGVDTTPIVVVAD